MSDKLPPKLPPNWGEIIWEKLKGIGAIVSFLLVDLGFVLLWGLVLLAFRWAIYKIDPKGEFLLLKIIETISEISTFSVVVFIIIIDTGRAMLRIIQKRKERPEKEKKLINGNTKQILENGARESETSDRISSE